MIGTRGEKIEKSRNAFYGKIDPDQLDPGFFSVGFIDAGWINEIFIGIHSQDLHLVTGIHQSLRDHIHCNGPAFPCRVGGFVAKHQDLHGCGRFKKRKILLNSLIQVSTSSREASVLAL